MPEGHDPLKRIAITGMSVNTPLGDSLEVLPDNLLQGRSAITRWKALDSLRNLLKNRRRPIRVCMRRLSLV